MINDFMPAFMIAERDALLAEIEKAFGGVSRSWGVSWSESRVIDDYGTDKERAAARAKDTEASWQGLLGSDWTPEIGVGGFAFLDAVGFRYYLPAAMVLSIRRGRDVGLLFFLTPSKADGEWQREKWSLVTPSQRRCVRRYLEYMYVLASDDSYTRGRFLEAPESYWGKDVEDTSRPEKEKSASGPKRQRRAHEWGA